MTPTRREIGAVGIGSVIGIGGLTAYSTDTASAQVTGEFTIPEVDKEIVDPVNSARLSAEGTFSWESDTVPTRAVLRLEVAQGQTDFEQLAAESFESGLEASHTQSFAFNDVNLFEHSAIATSDFVPEANGETISMTIHARLSLTVENDGDTLAESELQKSVPVTIEKTQGETTVTMGATGEIEIGTSE
jgi:hypothetical protein